jgi:hypothetical protein
MVLNLAQAGVCRLGNWKMRCNRPAPSCWQSPAACGLTPSRAIVWEKPWPPRKKLGELLKEAPTAKRFNHLARRPRHPHADHLEIALSSARLVEPVGLSADFQIGSVIHLTHPLLIQRRGVETKVMLASHL